MGIYQIQIQKGSGEKGERVAQRWVYCFHFCVDTPLTMSGLSVEGGVLPGAIRGQRGQHLESVQHHTGIESHQKADVANENGHDVYRPIRGTDNERPRDVSGYEGRLESLNLLRQQLVHLREQRVRDDVTSSQELFSFNAVSFSP